MSRFRRSMGTVLGDANYLSLFDYDVNTLVAAFKTAGVKPGA